MKRIEALHARSRCTYGGLSSNRRKNNGYDAVRLLAGCVLVVDREEIDFLPL